FFAPGPDGEEASAFSLERAPFDAMLIRAAQAAGATVVEECEVREISTHDDQGVVVACDAGRVRGRVLIDASGQGTIVGRKLGSRRRLPDLERVAYFQHFANAHRRPGKLGGSPIMVMCDDGWFWLIPLDEHRTSIGVVMSAQVAREIGVPPERMLSWAIERCPYVRRVC